MALNILNPGLSTSIQDLGRPGYFHLGIPIGGAMDRFAMRVANMLVGNAEDAAGLEAVFMGPEITFTEDTLIAITGAELPVMLAKPLALGFCNQGRGFILRLVAVLIPPRRWAVGLRIRLGLLAVLKAEM